MQNYYCPQFELNRLSLNNFSSNVKHFDVGISLQNQKPREPVAKVAPNYKTRVEPELFDVKASRNFSKQNVKKYPGLNGQKKHPAHKADYRSTLQSDRDCLQSFNER